ncbi:alpha/beta fold hydrolase [Scleromatobacter humisilvae]|uniref:Alpha/beta hydrolase n=1 Tax=Scleromatobacter humisilvae TaxID=2897159 RepID=A0A9X1YI63_9BURK|nr:alpha/beta hydrolase [Scleromatobacter humisilvae]MCK9685198.1 alpha/beta hydrolase [Scleromatobacter humisilvae]
MSAIVPTDHWIVTPSGRLFARQWQPQAAEPARAPIVLLHDSIGCVELWRDFPARLAAATGRRVLAYDRLGFGRSDARSGRPSRAFVAEEATTGFAALREQLAIGRFVVVGYSVGGGMAVEIAARTSTDCEALVTMSAQAFVEDRTLAGLRVAQAQFADPAQVKRLARYHGDKAAWALDAWLGQWLDPAFAAWTLDDALPRVTCPVLAIHGEQDEYGSAAHPRRIVDGVAGPARLEMLPGVGHVPTRERPELVVRLIADFLAGVA